MKKLTLILFMALIFTSIFFSSPVFASAATPIAIMVESGGFNSTNVSTDGGISLLWKKGDADTTGGLMRIAPSAGSKAGTVVRRNQIQITDGFSTYFQMDLHNLGGMGYGDGLAFLIYEADTPQIGSYGGGLGYEGIDKSIAVEFDIWQNGAGDKNDPDGEHVAIMLNGNSNHGSPISQLTSSAAIEGVVTNVWIDYAGGIVTATFGPNVTRSDGANKVITRNVGTFLEGKNVFVGFSASTGGAMADHDVLKWYFKGDYVVGGLSPTSGTYSQGASTVDISVSASENPLTADVSVKDAGGAAVNNAVGTLYLDDVSVGAFNTGAGEFSYTVPDNLVNGTHILRAVASGGASNFINFTVAKYSLTYNGNDHTGGAVPAAEATYSSGASVTVLGNTGSFVKTNYAFSGWNTRSDGTGTSYVAANSFSITTNTALYVVWDEVNAAIANSAGASSYRLGNTSGQVVDGQMTLTNGIDISGAKVYITTGFQSNKDELFFTDSAGIAGSYDAEKGVLTLTGTKTPTEYQAALRTIKFKTTGTTGERTIVYSLGNKLSYAGHFYEYVSNGGNILWTNAKTAAEARSFYGSTGYLAVITSQEENDFLRDKLGADAWIGASDSGAENDWKWAVNGPAVEAGVSFFNDTTGTTAAFYFSNWNTDEPNNSGNEDYAIMYCTGGTPGKWNDLPNSSAILGYLVEYNSGVGASSTKTLMVNNASSSTPPPAPGVVIVIVNGVEQNAGTETKTIEGNKYVVQVEVNNTIIEKKIAEAIINNPGGSGNVIQVPVADTTSDIAKVTLTGDIIKQLESNAFDLSIKRDDVEYLIPAEEFTISSVAKDLGVAEASLKDIKIEIKITKLDQTVVAKYNEVAKANGAELVFPPVEFEIIAKTTKTDGTTADVEISKFSNYVERIMEIPAGVDPSKITTGIVFNPDGTYSHVPTEVFQKDGKWYAKLNSLTNSNYSVVWNPVIVKSVANHWSKDAVNDMASRLVIFNPESFEPNKAITRADFAEYIVRALGLYREGSTHENKFKDVSATDERTLAILIANEYGIVSGYPDGTFRSDQKITREEAMAMYQRAMKVTKLVGVDQNRYQTYTDYKQVGSWATTYVKDVLSAHVFNGTTATTISPKANLTYAEAAQAIKNLLVESKLINK